MNTYKFQLCLLVVLGLIMNGCSSKAPYTLIQDYDPNWAKIIAVLPVENKSADSKAPQLMRSKVLDELYFKGYVKLPLEVIDKKLEPLYINIAKGSAGIIAPQVLKDLVGADAAMYCTLTEDTKSLSLFYVPVTIAATCQLRSTQTGEVLWSAHYKSTSRNFDFTRKGLERKSCETFENVVDEVVSKVMETLPDGPNLHG